MSVRDLEVRNPYNIQSNALQPFNGQQDLSTATAINVSGNASAAVVFGGIITSTTAAAVALAFPSGFAAALSALMPFNSVGSTVQCLVVNAGPNAITFSSSDGNTSLLDASASIASHTSRMVNFVISATTPAVVVY